MRVLESVKIFSSGFSNKEIVDDVDIMLLHYVGFLLQQAYVDRKKLIDLIYLENIYNNYKVTKISAYMSFTEKCQISTEKKYLVLFLNEQIPLEV